MKQIYYESTRGKAEKVPASRAILRGIAEDGGLYVPDSIPAIDLSIDKMVNMNYKDLAFNIMSKFFTDFTESELKECIESAYDSKFDTAEIAPVVKKGDAFFLELYHGPTLAFKDMALSILPYLLKTSARKQNIDKQIVILTATSGDTGKAALEGFSDVEGTKIIVFYPQDGVSDIQKKQMNTQTGKNTYVVGINGNFDDAQNGVKNIFSDKELAEKLSKNGFMFSSANSINIGRLVPQVVYYFHAYMTLCKNNEIAAGDKINFVVPTGNFGNILAAYFAKNMGLPINKLICASNDNKVLYDFMSTGTYDKCREFVTTISPSMDILISSNLERLLYLISNRNSELVTKLMNELKTVGKYSITDDMAKNLSDFYGNYATEENTLDSISKLFKNADYLIDTHTSVGYHVYETYKSKTGDNTKTVIASTASPYKFTVPVMSAIDDKYKDKNSFELLYEMEKVMKKPMPASINGIENRTVLHKAVCEKDEMKKVVENIILK